ncbi:MAG: OmpH family outer membrane protein [Planctomycetes bacterium]|nr:OmpH family outer membrane protein [Planctomycetota bacterium]
MRSFRPFAAGAALAGLLLLASGYRAGAEPQAPAPPGPGIGVVDLFRVMTEARPFAAAQGAIREWIESEKRSNLDVKKGEINAKEAELEMFARDSEEHRKLKNEIEFAKLRFEHEFERLEAERMRRITAGQRQAFDEASAAVAEYAKSRGIFLVLQQRTGKLRGELDTDLTSEMYLRDILYSDALLDITDAVIRILDAKR